MTISIIPLVLVAFALLLIIVNIIGEVIAHKTNDLKLLTKLSKFYDYSLVSLCVIVVLLLVFACFS